MTSNRLSREKSPYLLQHAHNPVDWYPWGDEAFERARRENKPIFLSIGYATCHWCHVMEKESFEDAEAAAHLNETFVCIKVDREERPDIDTVYMSACQMLTGGGGWPLTIFMTPEKKPFFAGTYIPKQNRFGRAGLLDLCRQVKNMWQVQNEKILTTADKIAETMDRAFLFQGNDETPTDRLLEQAYFQIEGGFDARFGGFESAPKFPTPHRLLFLLRHHHRHPESKALEMTEKTLTAMRLGGIWDHVGFGFHRYSTDKEWLLPHFEKMLYDQALLALPYLEAYQITKDPFYAQTAREIFTYVLRDMTASEGAFYTAEDADSEGEEGKFYVWSQREFQQTLETHDGERWARDFNLADGGNFHDEATGRSTGSNILHLNHRPEELAAVATIPAERYLDEWEQVRQKLFAHRKKRVHPLKDDKILTDWNGLMIAALARGGRVLADDALTTAAEKSARFMLMRMRSSDGRLMHRFRDNEVAIGGQAADYAFLILGLLELYQSNFDPVYLKEAVTLQKQMLTDFWDKDQDGFFLTATAEMDLPVRPKEIYDGAIPSANSVALQNLLRLSRLTGDPEWENLGHQLIKAFADTIKRQPTAFTYLLLGIDFALHTGQEVVITGEPEGKDTRQLLSALNLSYLPNQVTLLKSDQNARQLSDLAGFTDGLQVIEGRATAHVCRGFACKEATNNADEMLKQLFPQPLKK